jgi:hypothetical protein
MSESPPLSNDAILSALRAGGQPLPAEALVQAGARWPELADRFLDVLRRLSGNLPKSDHDLANFAIYLAAQAREPLAFPLLCVAARHPKRLDTVLGDGVTEDLEAIFVRTYDGDIDSLKSVVEATNADDYVREAALSALVTLAVDGLIPRETMRDYVGWLFENLRPRGEHFLWFGMQNAVAALGLTEFVPRALRLFEDAWVSKTISNPKGFQEDVAKAARSEDPLDVMHSHIRTSIKRLDDVVGYMETWAYYKGEDGGDHDDSDLNNRALLSALFGDRSRSDGKPYVNPHRNVGRNDPCPCGSGKKFKKCCLEVLS